MSALRRYALAIGLALGTIALALAVPMLQSANLPTICFAAVAVSAWFGGFGPGLLAAATTALLSDFFFVSQTYSFAIRTLDDLVDVAAFVLVALLLDSLIVAQRRAESEVRLKDETIALVSHDLGSPLNAITLWARMLARGDLPIERQRQAGEAIERSARLQRRLIEDLLDLSRLRFGHLRLEKRPVAMASAVTAALEGTSDAAGARGVAVTVEGDGAEVIADPERLAQIVANLLSNAIQETPAGGRVMVTLAADAHWSEVQVEDSGTGIQPDLLPHIFEPFRRGNGTRRPGLGLGLAIVRDLVACHGGTVTAANTEHGALFTVRLPRA